MPSRPIRRFTWQFKVQLCSDIRSGVISRSEAQRKHRLSGQLMTLWLGQFDRGELSQELAEPALEDERELTIAALQRKVGELTMQVDLLKKTPRPALVRSSDPSLIITGPPADRSEGDAS
jgi:transposase-like protein